MNKSNQQQSLVIIKPDGVQRSLIGEIVKRYERVGLKLLAMKMVIPTIQQARQHYSSDPQWVVKKGQSIIEKFKAQGKTTSLTDQQLGQNILDTLIKYITSGPVVVMVWQGTNAIKLIRKITGGTEPLTSDVGTIRGDYTLDSYQNADMDNRSVRNLVHASGSPEEAQTEIALWFKPEEILKYRLIAEQILYDINLDGILE